MHNFLYSKICRRNGKALGKNLFLIDFYLSRYNCVVFFFEQKEYFSLVVHYKQNSAFTCFTAV